VDSVVVLDDVELIPVLETRAIRVCHGRPAIPVWPSPRPAAGVASLLAGVPRRGRDHRVGTSSRWLMARSDERVHRTRLSSPRRWAHRGAASCAAQSRL